jgi:hypothetical protein
MPDRPGADAWLAVEAAAAGLAFGSLLEWASTALVGSFRPQYLADPYWRGVPWLRTDTSGFAAFIVAGICLLSSEYLRLRRRRRAASAGAARLSPASAGAARLSPASAGAARLSPASAGEAALLAMAAAETVAVLATGLFVYLSVNAVTHHFTLQIQATHLLSWPTEGTLRVAALLLCIVSFGVVRYLRPRIAVRR